MKAAQGRIGRVFVIRLEDGDLVPECIERFAAENGVSVGHAVLVGGIRRGQVVVGPRDSDAMPPEPMLLPIDDTHEVVGVGVLAPNEDGEPVLHIHAALGRSRETLTGCLRHGVSTWLAHALSCIYQSTNLPIPSSRLTCGCQPRSSFARLTFAWFIHTSAG